MTGVLPGQPGARRPDPLGAFAGILSERSGMLNIAIEGKMLDRGVRRGDRRERQRDPGATPLGVFTARRWPAIARRLSCSAWLGIQPQGRSDHRGCRLNIGARHHELPVPAHAVEEHQLNTPPTIEASSPVRLSDIPVIGPILFTGTPYLYFTSATW